jgi:hypothetical protein
VALLHRHQLRLHLAAGAAYQPPPVQIIVVAVIIAANVSKFGLN